MKGGTEYAKRVKKVYKRLRGAATDDASPDPPELVDPLEQLMLGLLGAEGDSSDAAKALRQLTAQMIDLNEVRVSSVHEIAAVIRRSVPNSTECARNIRRSLNDIFQREHRVSLESLSTRGRREARQYLESLNGATPFAVALVLMRSLGAHAIPVSNPLLEALRAADLVDQAASVAEVQAFLERNIPAAEGRFFCDAMGKLVEEHAERAAKQSAKGQAKKSKAAKEKKATNKKAAGKKTARRTKKTPGAR